MYDLSMIILLTADTQQRVILSLALIVCVPHNNKGCLFVIDCLYHAVSHRYGKVVVYLGLNRYKLSQIYDRSIFLTQAIMYISQHFYSI